MKKQTRFTYDSVFDKIFGYGDFALISTLREGENQ
jgi:hypothetical protein